MRIPAEVVPPVSNISKEPDDVRKPEPVSSATTIANDLSGGLQDQLPPGANPPPRRQPAAAEAGGDVPPEAHPPAIERRQRERRIEKRPVLLDTRSKSGRRKAGGDVKVNIKV